MKRIALMVLVGLIAATPAVAASKKKAKKMHAAAAQTTNPNEAGWRLTRDALPSLMPTALKIIYFSMPEHKAKAK